MSNETDYLTAMVCTEKLRQTKQTARARYAAGTLRTMVPIEPGYSFIHEMPLRWARRELLISKAQQIKETDATLGERYNPLSRRCF